MNVRSFRSVEIMSSMRTIRGVAETTGSGTSATMISFSPLLITCFINSCALSAELSPRESGFHRRNIPIQRNPRAAQRSATIPQDLFPSVRHNSICQIRVLQQSLAARAGPRGRFTGTISPVTSCSTTYGIPPCARGYHGQPGGKATLISTRAYCPCLGALR